MACLHLVYLCHSHQLLRPGGIRNRIVISVEKLLFSQIDNSLFWRGKSKLVGRYGGNCIKSCRIKAVAKTEVTQLVFLCVPAETFPYATNYAIRHILLFFSWRLRKALFSVHNLTLIKCGLSSASSQLLQSRCSRKSRQVLRGKFWLNTYRHFKCIAGCLKLSSHIFCLCVPFFGVWQILQKIIACNHPDHCKNCTSF